MLTGLSWRFPKVSVLPCFGARAALRSVEVLPLEHWAKGFSDTCRVAGTGSCRFHSLLPTE